MDTRFPPIRLIRRVVDAIAILVVVAGLGMVVLGRVLPLLGHQVFVVAGSSMEPAIGIGAAVVLEDVDPALLAVGDVVSLHSGPDHAVFTHRIVRLATHDGAMWLETKGDANATADPSITRADAVVGRVAMTVPLAGFLLALVSIPQGVLFVIATGALLLVAGWLLESIERDRRRDGWVPDQPAASLDDAPPLAATPRAIRTRQRTAARAKTAAAAAKRA